MPMIRTRKDGSRYPITHREMKKSATLSTKYDENKQEAVELGKSLASFTYEDFEREIFSRPEPDWDTAFDEYVGDIQSEIFEDSLPTLRRLAGFSDPMGVGTYQGEGEGDNDRFQTLYDAAVSAYTHEARCQFESAQEELITTMKLRVAVRTAIRDEDQAPKDYRKIIDLMEAKGATMNIAQEKVRHIIDEEIQHKQTFSEIDSGIKIAGLDKEST
jgi:hypothetical protein